MLYKPERKHPAVVTLKGLEGEGAQPLLWLRSPLLESEPSLPNAGSMLFSFIIGQQKGSATNEVNQIYFRPGRGSAPDPAGEAHDSFRSPSRMGLPLYSQPRDVFRCLMPACLSANPNFWWWYIGRFTIFYSLTSKFKHSLTNKTSSYTEALPLDPTGDFVPPDPLPPPLRTF